jgi:hypothetical protein
MPDVPEEPKKEATLVDAIDAIKELTKEITKLKTAWEKWMKAGKF